MNGNMKRSEIQKVLVNEFSEIGDLFGLINIDIRDAKNNTSIYLVGINALELEIDWHENTLFIYVVRLNDGKIPSEDIIYKYQDGTWCRIYVDEVYQKKNPIYQLIDRKNPYFLLELLQYYKRLIKSNPEKLHPYFHIEG